MASVALIRSVRGGSRLCVNFVAELPVQLHDFLGALRIGSEAPFPSIGGQRAVGFGLRDLD